MKKNNSITVGIVAYNEQANIRNIIMDLLNQKKNHYVLDKIMIISDGSNDGTNTIVQSIKSNKIQLIVGKTRQGKANRLNHLLHNLKSDYLVLFDADVNIYSPHALDNISKILKKNSKIGIVQTNVRPIKGKSFIERAVNNFFYSRDSVSHKYKYAESVYGARGGGIAIRKALAQRITLPFNTLNDDAFLYFKCIFSGFRFKYAKNTIILYRSPQNWKDLYNQTLRYAYGEKQIQEYFNRPETYTAYTVPDIIQLEIFIKQIIRNPFGYFLIKFINSFALIKVHYSNNVLNHKWNIIASSKIL